MAKDNRTIGKFKLNGIKKAPAGVPQIEVSFDIDENGILKVSAKDLDTGKAQSITISANERMSDEEIQQAIKDAELYAEQDKTRCAAMDIVNSAEQAVVKVEQAVSKAGKQLPKEEKKQVKAACSEVRKLLIRSKPEKMNSSDIAAIKEAVERMEQLSENAVRLSGQSPSA